MSKPSGPFEKILRENEIHREVKRELLETCERALALLDKGAPGWGVAKDILRTAIAKAKGEA